MALTFAEFFAKSFIQKVTTQPIRTSSVLSFYYGVNLIDTDARPQAIRELKEGSPWLNMEEIWYKGHPEYDKLCRFFAPAVRAACDPENSQLKANDDGLSDVDHLVARMVLCDQIARNAFRGDPEAFKYDDVAENIALKLAAHALNERSDDGMNPDTLTGEVYPTYILSCILPLMHSESMESHKRGKQVIDWAVDASQPGVHNISPQLHQKFEYVRGFLLDHTKVIVRFGRYPHRNKAYGRESTPEELVWLSSEEEVPGWAKSQG